MLPLTVFQANYTNLNHFIKTRKTFAVRGNLIGGYIFHVHLHQEASFKRGQALEILQTKATEKVVFAWSIFSDDFNFK